MRPSSSRVLGLEFEPGVSVVIPTYRDAVRTLEAVASVQRQSYADWRIHIIDDGSNEHIQKALEEGITNLADPRVHLHLSKRNRGPARNRNLGLRMSRTRFVAFLDADDLWEPGKLQTQLAAIRENNAALCCTGYRNISEKSGKTSVRSPPERFEYTDLLKENFVGCSTVLLDREKTGRIYFPDVPMRQDFALWLLLLRRGSISIGIPDPLTTRRLHGNSLSANKLRAISYTWRIFRDTQSFSRFKAIRVFLTYFATMATKRLGLTTRQKAK